ncbi:MAG: response regulator transcription factor, partial [Bdellovibrionota bacterium]
MKLLVVEDDKKIAGFLTKGLTEAGYAVDATNDGMAGYELASRGNYDLLILDMMLPKLDGMALISKLRNDGVQSKVLILSAKSSVDDRVAGLQSGGDDYLIKPFAFAELLARCQALLRRPMAAPKASRLKQGNVSIDFISREVFRDGKKV